MKKVFYLSIVVVFALFMTNCSEDTVNNADEVFNFQEKSGSIYEAYIPLLDELYSNYEILSENVIEITDVGRSYRVTEVRDGEDITGYFVEVADEGNLVFLDHYEDFVAYYDLDNDIEEIYDLTTDPEYDGNFSYEEPEGNTETSTRRFWGWSCGPEITLGGTTCYRICCYYIFWVQICSAEPEYSCGNLPGSNPHLQ